ncbi:MAG: hypothetical protein ACRELZ_20220 [Candidatus Rokuibacteriota bacterium]
MVIAYALNGVTDDHCAPGADRLRVRFVAQRFPYPADTGGKIRTARLLEQLSRRLDITLVSNVERPKNEFAATRPIAEEVIHHTPSPRRDTK